MDLGCGDGTLAARLTAMGCTVTGVDSSLDMVTEAQTRGIDAHVMDGHDLESRYGIDNLCPHRLSQTKICRTFGRKADVLS